MKLHKWLKYGHTWLIYVKTTFIISGHFQNLSLSARTKGRDADFCFLKGGDLTDQPACCGAQT